MRAGADGPARKLGGMEGTALPVLVYDGDCGFCTAWAGRAATMLDGRARVVPWQQLEHDGLAGLGLTAEEAGDASWWVDGGGRRFGGAASVAKVLEASGGPRRPLGAAMGVPPVSWLAAGVYALVVRLRHRLPGATPECRRSNVTP